MDDGIPIGLILLFIFCLLGSFYFSGTEMAFSAVNRIRMRSRADEGDKRARRVIAVLDNFDNALTTILIGNNIVNISLATIGTIIATNLWGAGSVAAATLVVTVLVFMLGETLPKTMAKAMSEQVALTVAGSLLFLMKAFKPLAFVFSKITAVISRPFRKNTRQLTVTEEELRDIIEDAVEDGALNEETGELVQSAIRYTDATVRDIITSWKDVRKLPLSTPHEAVLDIVRQSSHSRLPVVDETGTVLGFLRIRKYLKATLRGQASVSIADVMEPVSSVPVTTPVNDLLPLMSGHKTHFILVRDEWENVLGIVTMEDILERLVGDIWDEEDEVSDTFLSLGETENIAPKNPLQQGGDA